VIESGVWIGDGATIGERGRLGRQARAGHWLTVGDVASARIGEVATVETGARGHAGDGASRRRRSGGDAGAVWYYVAALSARPAGGC
jgi:hypothetical protein